ncbi:hypothetical protein CTM67_16405 [Photobacterium phosphoreum]|nr:hypothetical protein CTM67_16405 [Photobacterium phosphoreum]
MRDGILCYPIRYHVQRQQDRLIKKMRITGIDSIEEANAWLSEFIADFNQRFARTPYSLGLVANNLNR